MSLLHASLNLVTSMQSVLVLLTFISFNAGIVSYCLFMTVFCSAARVIALNLCFGITATLSNLIEIFAIRYSLPIIRLATLFFSISLPLFTTVAQLMLHFHPTQSQEAMISFYLSFLLLHLIFIHYLHRNVYRNHLEVV